VGLLLVAWSVPVPAAEAPKPGGAAAAKAAAPKASRPAGAIEYKQTLTDEEYQKNYEKYRRYRTRIHRMLQAQAFAAGEEEDFDAYYKDYALARWAVAGNYTSLPEFRRDLRNDLFAGKSGPPYERLLNMALVFLTNISKSGYHPAVRFNAMLMLGELNVQENPPGSKAPIVPLPAATKVLLDALKNSDSDAVKVAVLLGLLRHAQQAAGGVGLADAQVRNVEALPALLELAKSAPPAGRSRSGHGWMRAIAIDILAALRLTGPNGSVVTALVEIAGDKTAPMITRMAAARALGALDYQGFAQLSPSQIATPLGQLAIDACGVELSRHVSQGGLASRAAEMPGGMMPGGMMPGGMMPGGMPGVKPGEMSSRMAGGMPGPMMPGGAAAGKKRSPAASGDKDKKKEKDKDKDEAVDSQAVLFRRGLKQCLNAVRLGLNGPVDRELGGVRVLAAEGSADRAFVDGLWKLLQDEMKILEKQDEDYESLAKETIAVRTELREFLKGGPAAAAAAPAAKGAAPPPKK